MCLLHDAAHFLLGLYLAVSDTSGGYRFTVDGEVVEPSFCAVATTVPVQGDVVIIGGVPLCLDEPGAYDFKTEGGKVMRTLPGGRQVTVACSVTEEYDSEGAFPDAKGRVKGRTKKSNPLTTMTDEELRSLRGVSLNAWPEGIERQLARLDLERVCLEVSRDAFTQGKEVSLAALPDGVRALSLNSRGTDRSWDLSRLRQMKRLRLLDMQHLTLDAFDAGVLRDLPLEYLSTPWVMDKAINADALASLTRLKWLYASCCSYLGDARWMSQLMELQELCAIDTVSPTGGEAVPLDLAVLSGLTRLQTIHADGSLVKSLPLTNMPSLLNVTLLLSKAPPEDLKVFMAANPQARVAHSLNAELAAQLTGVDRLVVKVGHPGSLVNKERQILEIVDRGEIEQFCRHLEVIDAESGGHCRCNGEPMVEFYRGDTRVAKVGIHHGVFIRWEDGSWPGDGTLTQSSSEYLVEWTAQHGYTRLKEGVLQARRWAATDKRRKLRCRALMPVALHEALSEAKTAQDASEAWSRMVPNPHERATLLLRLYGADDSAWEEYTGWDLSVEQEWLPKIPDGELRAAIRTAAEQTQEGQGAARWLFGAEHASEWVDEPDVLRRLALLALTHPQPDNRWGTMGVLRDLGTPLAREILRNVMRKGTQPRLLTAKEARELGDMEMHTSGRMGLPAGTPDEVVAALCLAILRDEESTKDIDRIKKTLNETMRKGWDETLAEYKE